MGQTKPCAAPVQSECVSRVSSAVVPLCSPSLQAGFLSRRCSQSSVKRMWIATGKWAGQNSSASISTARPAPRQQQQQQQASLPLHESTATLLLLLQSALPLHIHPGRFCGETKLCIRAHGRRRRCAVLSPVRSAAIMTLHQALWESVRTTRRCSSDMTAVWKAGGAMCGSRSADATGPQGQETVPTCLHCARRQHGGRTAQEPMLRPPCCVDFVRLFDPSPCLSNRHSMSCKTNWKPPPTCAGGRHQQASSQQLQVSPAPSASASASASPSSFSASGHQSLLSFLRSFLPSARSSNFKQLETNFSPLILLR